MNKSSTLLIIAAAMIAATNLALSVAVGILFNDAEALKQENVGSGESTNLRANHDDPEAKKGDNSKKVPPHRGNNHGDP